MRGWRILGASALAVFVAATAWSPIRPNDTWIHLTTGRSILERGAVPRQDEYSFTAAGARYVAHEWLAATLYALAERAAGTPGVVAVGKLLPALAAAALALAIASRGGGAAALPVCVLAWIAARSRILARPELLAIPLLLAVLGLLLRHRQLAGRDRALLWLIPLAALWANVHASFPVGIAAVLLFAGVGLLESPDARRRRTAHVLAAGAALAVAAGLARLEPASFGLAAAGVALIATALLAVGAVRPLFANPETGPVPASRLFAVAGAMALASLANPRGAEILRFPFEFTAGVNPVTMLIGEWRPLLEAPPILIDSLAFQAYLLFLALGFGALARAAWRGRLGRLEAALFLGFALLPLRHARWIALSALATAPFVARALQAARGPAAAPTRARRAVAALLVLPGLAALALALFFALRARSDAALLAALALGAGCASAALACGFGRSPARVSWLAAGCAAALAGLAVAHGVPERPGLGEGGFDWRLRESRLRDAQVRGNAAIRFLGAQGLSGNLLTEYEWAGYAIHELWPGVRVFIDSRSEVYGGSLLLEHARLRRDPAAARRALRRYDIDLVLVRHRAYPGSSRFNAGILSAVEADPRYALVYADDWALVFARREPGRVLPEPLEGLGWQSFHPDRVAEPDARLEATLRRALERAPDSSFLRYALAAQLHARGLDAEAREQLERAWRANPDQPLAPFLAGELAEDADQARRWFERASRAAPHWSRPRRRLQALEDRGPSG